MKKGCKALGLAARVIGVLSKNYLSKPAFCFIIA